jgi:cob(I)alamin adenosyltransferase
MSIYTGTGDNGFTSTLNRKMIAKNSAIISLLGTLDELNCTLGVARNKVPPDTNEIVYSLQTDIQLFSNELSGGERFVTKEKTLAMEKSIDLIMESIAEHPADSLSWKSEAGAALDLARAVARRAERELIASKQSGGINREATMWVNRLSDFIYALARLMDTKAVENQVPVISSQGGAGLARTAQLFCKQDYGFAKRYLNRLKK